MKRTAALVLFAVLPLAAQQYKIAVVGLAHTHVWSHLPEMLKGDPVKLVGVADESQESLDRAKRTVPAALLYTDYKKMIDETMRSEEHTSELQSPMYLVCRLLL